MQFTCGQQLCSDGRESVHDHSDEQVDQLEVEHDEANDEKEVGYEELRLDHGIPQS
jgi:hypothetical protein